MPRLVGRRTYTDSYLALICVFAIAVGILLEYFGYINVISGFGRDKPYKLKWEDTELLQ